MSPGVEGDGFLEVQVGDDVCGGEGAESGVEVGDVGLMVLGMVQGHDLGADLGFAGLEMVSRVLRARG